MQKKTLPLVCVGILICFPDIGLAQQYSIYSKGLANGLEVIVIENSVVPLVTIELDVRNGSHSESPEYNGLSHLYEHMFFKANASVPSQEKYLERMQEFELVFQVPIRPANVSCERKPNCGSRLLQAGLEKPSTAANHAGTKAFLRRRGQKC